MKIYLLHGGVLGIVLVTTNTENIKKYLAESLTPKRYGLLVYEDGGSKPEHMAVDEFLPPKNLMPKINKHKYKKISTILIEENYCKSLRGVKARITKGVTYNGQPVDSPDFMVDLNVPGSIRVGKYMKTILGIEKPVKTKRTRRKRSNGKD